MGEMQMIRFIGEIQSAALPALRVIGTVVVLVLVGAGLFIYHNRHRLFDRDPNVEDDIPAVRDIRLEEVILVWGALTLDCAKRPVSSLVRLRNVNR